MAVTTAFVVTPGRYFLKSGEVWRLIFLHFFSSLIDLMIECKPKYSIGQVGTNTDFCIMVRPEEEEQELIDGIRIHRPCQSINHVTSLKRWPIYATVHMAQPSQGFDFAMKRAAVWHTAQWRNFKWSNVDNNCSEFQCGIMVREHEWYFNASSPVEVGDCVVFPSYLPLGGTHTEAEFLKLLASLQLLAEDARERFWPAFKKDVLYMP